MSAGATSAAAGSAAYITLVANAIKACGTVIRVEPDEFIKLVSRQETPLIVIHAGGLFSTSYKYMTSYRGLAFHCKSPTELRLPEKTELIHASKMSIPDI